MPVLLDTKHRQRQWLQAEKATFPAIAPRCPYVGRCGGCNLQDLAYEHQLLLKERFLAQALQPLGIPSVPVAPLADPWRYRNKIELTFGTSQEQLTLGLHAINSFWRIVDLDDCWLIPEPLARVMRTVRTWAQATGLPTYDPKRHTGFFRYLLLRWSHATQQILVCLITSPGPREAVAPLAASLSQTHPDVTSFYWGVSAKLADIAVPDELVLLAGQPYLRERVGPFDVDLHPLSFFQPNLAQAERIYETLEAWVRARGVRSAWDLYAGMGLIAFYLSRVASAVLCVESEPQNVQLLQHNAALNRLQGLTCRADRTEEYLRYLGSTLPTPDCIVVDPPRSGLHKHVIRALAQHATPCLIYLSCNPTALVADLQALRSLVPSYRLTAAQAFDMFPHTAHLETLVCLER